MIQIILSFVLIDPFLHELWPLNLANFMNFSVSSLFMPVVVDIELIFGKHIRSGMIKNKLKLGLIYLFLQKA